jgi:hypothetical protein
MNKERLTILRNALLSIKEDRKFQGLLFRYDTWAERTNKDAELGSCGTSGCALGLCPILFPNHFQVQWFDGKYGGRIAYSGKPQGNMAMARDFFDLPSDEAAWDIFNGLYLNDAGERLLLRDITPKMVAARIGEYLQRQE